MRLYSIVNIHKYGVALVNSYDVTLVNICDITLVDICCVAPVRTIFAFFLDAGAVGNMFIHLFLGRLAVSLFIYLFICWSSRMTALLLCYSIAPCTFKGGISAISHLWRFVFSFNI